MTANARTRLLDDAAKLVNGDRNATYDEPLDNFLRIAALWSAYLNVPIGPADVAVLNVLQKVGRLMHTPGHVDSWVDIAGYAACGADVTQGLSKK
ncbi:MAG: DUF6378 domain-containing protein [Ilumatobacteraceae bacterium]